MKKKRLFLDPYGFFVIGLDKGKRKIVVEHYIYSRKIKNKFSGNSAKKLCDTIIRRGLISRLDHAAYFGRELMKAEIALKNSLRYKQH